MKMVSQEQKPGLSVRHLLDNPKIFTIISWLAIGLTLLVMVLVAYSSLNKPFIMDEMEFPAVAQAIKETGRPVYYRGETNPANIGLWHPPLYIATLAGWQLLFGSSVFSNRAYGLFNALLALGLVGWLVMQRWKPQGEPNLARWLKPAVLLVGLGVGVSSPLLIQGSILPDIDTQVLPLTVTAAFVGLFELRRRLNNPWLYWLLFTLIILVQFFAKLTTPVLLIPSFMVFETLRQLSINSRTTTTITPSARTWQRAFLYGLIPLVAGMLSLVGMVAFWFVVALLWGVNFSYPFTYLTQSTNNPTTYGNGLGAILESMLKTVPGNFRYYAQWIGHPAVLFVVLMLGREFFKPVDGILRRWERTAIYTFLILLSLMYLVLRPAPFEFPKYWPPLIPLFSLLVIELLVSIYKAGKLGLSLGLLLIEIVCYIAYILTGSQFVYKELIHDVEYTAVPDTLFWNWVLLPLLLALIVNILVWLISKRKIQVPLLVAALAIGLGWQLTEVSKQIVRPYATTYYYGENSLSETITYLRQTLPSGAILIAPKDLGFALQDHWHYIELDTDPRAFFDNPKVQYMVLRNNDYYGNTIRETLPVAQEVKRRFELPITIKNFQIYKKRSIPLDK